MSKPEIKPENHQAMYEYYQELEPNHRLLMAVHRASSFIFRPRTHFAKDAEHDIAERLDAGDRIIIASNHLHINDQFPLSAIIKRNASLRPLMGRTFALAKAPYFENQFLRTALDASGTLPVFRPKDLPDQPRLQASSARSLIETSAKRIIDGWNMFLFPEGTRNEGNASELGKVQSGVGRIASQASHEVGVTILPMALWYGEGQDHHGFKPDVFIGSPIVGPFDTKQDAVIPLRDSLEDCLSYAIESSLDRD